jgi:hypothetical protein
VERHQEKTGYQPKSTNMVERQLLAISVFSSFAVIFGQINEDIPQQLKYAIIVTKKKDSKSDCGITTGELLSVIIKSLLSKSHNRLATLQIPNYL